MLQQRQRATHDRRLGSWLLVPDVAREAKLSAKLTQR